MDKSETDKAASDKINNNNRAVPAEIRKTKYLNNIVEQNHHFIKLVVLPLLKFKSFQQAKDTLAGIELMHKIRKGQMMIERADKILFSKQFYVLTG